MEDTESSDFLSSYDSLYSANSATTDREDQSYIDFDVVFSDGLGEAAKAEEDFESVHMIPNSRLSSNDHPVLIRLENEYQARRSNWLQRPGQYCRYIPEADGRTACPTQNNLTSAGSELSSRKQDKPLKNIMRPEVAKRDLSQELKRQRVEEEGLPSRWWAENGEQNLPVSEGDRIFAQKCRELQGFIKPLTELLNGLKRGRYDRGLSSFQQSVAMDRIQRIVGVLQKPEMGERYLGTLLQVEMMLKVWFPSVTSSSSSPSTSDDDMEEPQCKMAKNSDASSSEQKVCQLKKTPLPCSQSLGKPSEGAARGQGQKDCLCCNERIQVLADWPTMNLTWMQTAPICNPTLSQVNQGTQVNRALDQDLLGPSSCGIIFLVQNLQDSRSQPQSVVQTEKLAVPHPSREAPQEEHPPRSQSAPAVILCDRTRPETKAHSRSLPHLPTCTQRPVGENT